MPSAQKVKLFKKVAIFLTFMWTLAIYTFYNYQIQNENAHVLQNTITQAKTSVSQAKELMLFSFNQKIKVMEKNKDVNLQTDFSIRNFIYATKNKQNNEIKIEGEYFPTDMENLNKNVKKAITRAQKTQQDTHTSYEKADENRLFYIAPLVADESCSRCHVHDDKKAGDILGNVNMNMKIPTFREFNPQSFLFLTFTYVTMWLTGLIIIWWIKYKINHLFNEKIKSFEDSVYSFVNMMERRDRYTAGHSKRVAKYASLIAAKMNLSDEKIDLLYRAGMLHDIGKIEIPDAVLLKPDTLTSGEYDLVKKHSTTSYELLSREPFHDIAKIVLHHHERYDGQGYPLGLKGVEIPLLSQIIAVADTFDAITTNRSYKSALSKEEAISIILSESGKQFNPHIVNIAKEIFLNIEIENDLSQTSEDMLKDIRFSYYFRDQLTGHCNINYLKYLLTHKKDFENICAYYINCRGFAPYNKTNGWKKGDKLLQTIADKLQEIYPKSIIIRIFADKFLLLHLNEHVSIEKNLVKSILKDYNLTLQVNRLSNLEEDADTVDKLEEIILGKSIIPF